MDWPWCKQADFGDIFEEQVEEAVQIESKLVFSGIAKDASLEFELPEEIKDKQMFVIERRLQKSKKTDQHIFIVNTDSLEMKIDWYHYSSEGKENKPVWRALLDNELGCNEITRILNKHWNFSKQL